MSAMSDLDADLQNLVGNPYIHTESVDKLKDEIARLRALNDAWKLTTDELCEIIERLRAALREIAEDQEGDYDFIVWQARTALGEKE